MRNSGPAILALLLFTTAASAQITLYEREGFRGRAYTAEVNINNLADRQFNDRASSVIVSSGRWEVCTDANFRGSCRVLRRGSYETLSSMGIENQISSMRRVNRPSYQNEAPEPAFAPEYPYYRRPAERVFSAPITSVRAVVNRSTQRCWVEREQVSSAPQVNDVGGAIAGAIIGGIIGHQIGKGRGNAAATAAGAAIGAGAAGNWRPGHVTERNVQRCVDSGDARPDYWDVTYDFRGREYHAQLSHPPGATIIVNQDGTPRE
jgi:uncharacterized protein YcfJ